MRPRAGGFCYDEAETKIMMEEARLLLENGADGIAFGFLHADGTVHRERTPQMSELIHSFGKEAVFHRAFDVTKDPFQAMEVLLSCKIDRLLTSGQRAKAMQGAELIAQLQDRFGDRIEIWPAAASTHRMQENCWHAGIRQVHSSCKGYRLDPTTASEHVSYAYLDDAHAMEYDVVEETLCAR
ncbi:MAG: copper homeostasis protein CutC [Merdibacter sp.]